MASEQSRTRRMAMRMAAFVVLAGVALLLVARLWGGDGGGGDDNGGGSDADLSQETPQVEDENGDVTTTLAEPGTPVEPTCPATDGSSPREVSFAAPPLMCIDPAVTYVAVIQTTRGDFEITLDTEAAPLAANNFVFLARWHYYDGVGFHRVVPGFVVQGGDAVGPVPGTGGPGYSFQDELPTGAPPFYPLMSVAMANSGPNTNGSQFFIVTGPQGEQLPAQYTRFGAVTAGAPVVEEIDATGDPSSAQGVPTDLTVIERITIEERAV